MSFVSSIRRIQRWRRSTQRRRRSPITCAMPAASILPQCVRTSTPSVCRTGSNPGSSAVSTTTREPRSSSTSPGARDSSRRSAAGGAPTAPADAPGRGGQQQAIGGGGRYDGLVELLGGRPTPGIGFGIGIDRLIIALTETGGEMPPEPPLVAVVVGADPDDTPARLAVATDLRAAGIASRAELGRRKLGKQLEAASRDQAHFAVIVGDELASGEVGLRDLPAGTQKVVPMADLAREIERAHRAHRHGTAPD